MQEDPKFKVSLYRLARSAVSKEKGKDGGRGLGLYFGISMLA